jgi:hypothetical protein
MSKNITAQGSYTNKSGQEVSFDFDYTAIDSVEDAVSLLGEDKVKSLVQRMLKLDASNTAREKAKSDNGDSTRKVMSEEEKAQAKAERKIKTQALQLLVDGKVDEAQALLASIR